METILHFQLCWSNVKINNIISVYIFTCERVLLFPASLGYAPGEVYLSVMIYNKNCFYWRFIYTNCERERAFTYEIWRGWSRSIPSLHRVVVAASFLGWPASWVFRPELRVSSSGESARERASSRFHRLLYTIVMIPSLLHIHR